MRSDDRAGQAVGANGKFPVSTCFCSENAMGIFYDLSLRYDVYIYIVISIYRVIDIYIYSEIYV